MHYLLQRIRRWNVMVLLIYGLGRGYNLVLNKLFSKLKGARFFPFWSSCEHNRHLVQKKPGLPSIQNLVKFLESLNKRIATFRILNIMFN